MGFVDVSVLVIPTEIFTASEPDCSASGQAPIRSRTFVAIPFHEPDGARQGANRALPFLLLTALSPVGPRALCSWTRSLCVCCFPATLAPYEEPLSLGSVRPACGVSRLGGLAFWGDLTLLARFLEPLSKPQDKTRRQHPGSTTLEAPPWPPDSSNKPSVRSYTFPPSRPDWGLRVGAPGFQPTSYCGTCLSTPKFLIKKFCFNVYS